MPRASTILRANDAVRVARPHSTTSSPAASAWTTWFEKLYDTATPNGPHPAQPRPRS